MFFFFTYVSFPVFFMLASSQYPGYPWSGAQEAHQQEAHQEAHCSHRPIEIKSRRVYYTATDLQTQRKQTIASGWRFFSVVLEKNGISRGHVEVESFSSSIS